CSGAVSSAGVQRDKEAFPGPDDHFAAGPDRREISSSKGRVNAARSCPAIGAGIVSPAGLRGPGDTASAPDDHFTASPYGCELRSFDGRVGQARGHPTTPCQEIVSSTGVQQASHEILPTPNDHLAAGRYCRMPKTPGGRIGSAGWRPTIGDGVV